MARLESPVSSLATLPQTPLQVPAWLLPAPTLGAVGFSGAVTDTVKGLAVIRPRDAFSSAAVNFPRGRHTAAFRIQ